MYAKKLRLLWKVKLSKTFKNLDLIVLSLCVSVYLCVGICTMSLQYIRRPEEGAGDTGAKVTGSFDLSYMVAEI